MTLSSVKITWWQFSDLHWPAKPAPERQAFIKSLLAGIREHILPAHGPADFLVMTGDVVFSGQAPEYASAEESFFGALREVAGPGAPMFLVPGNHDQSRLQAANLDASRVTAITTATQLDAFLDETRSCQMYLTPFEDYRDFADHQAPPGCADPLVWNTTRDFQGVRIQIAGLNSA
jgi:predicted MPP superfamily phosphohydrolase